MEKNEVFGGNGTGDGIKITVDRVRSFYTHTHVYSELIIYQPFDGFITVNGRRVETERAVAALITPSDFHSITVNGASEAEYIKIAFDHSLLASYLRERINVPILLFDHSDNAIFSEMSQRLTEKNMSLSHRKILLNALLLEMYQRGESVKSPAQKRSADIVLQAAGIITEGFNSDLTLSSVAAVLHITPQYLSGCFSKYMQLNFSDYLSGLRLNYAASLLSEGEKNVTEVCFKCGYRNLSHFLRSFKKKFGVTPKQYSNLQSGGAE